MSSSSATVAATRTLNPRLRRIVLTIDDPEALAVAAGADSAVGVYFPDAGGSGRNYTVRAQRGAEIDLDIVLHAHGPGSVWAAAARPGDWVVLDHARSWYRPPADTTWQLLVCDLAGLPAAARIIEELPAGASAIVLVEVADVADLDYLPRRAQVRVVPTVGTGNGDSPSRLAGLVHATPLPGGPGYCWFAGEAAQSRAVRKYLRGLGWSLDRYDVTGYWRFGSQAWDAEFARVADDLVPVYTRALAAGKSEKAAAEEFDAALEQAGL